MVTLTDEEVKRIFEMGAGSQVTVPTAEILSFRDIWRKAPASVENSIRDTVEGNRESLLIMLATFEYLKVAVVSDSLRQEVIGKLLGVAKHFAKVKRGFVAYQWEESGHEVRAFVFRLLAMEAVISPAPSIVIGHITDLL